MAARWREWQKSVWGLLHTKGIEPVCECYALTPQQPRENFLAACFSFRLSVRSEHAILRHRAPLRQTLRRTRAPGSK
jgi:hypothetical protein